MDLTRSLATIVRPFRHWYLCFANDKTLGVRAIVIDKKSHVFLVKHSYTSGWFLPGGGVEIGESAPSALARELAEEGNIQLSGVPQLFGIYINSRISKRDYVVLFVVSEFQQKAPQPNFEIVAHGFFSPDALPDDTSQATRARIAEVFNDQPVTEIW